MDEEKDREEKKEDKEEIVSEPEAGQEKPEEPTKPLVETNNMVNKSENMTNKLRKNPFILSTLVCGSLALLLLVIMVSGGSITGNVSKERAGENLMGYLSTIVDSEVELLGVVDAGALYEATIDYDGQEIPVYITKDGSAFTSNLIPLSVPTTDAPSQDTQTPSQSTGEYSEEDLVKLTEFSSCLAQNGIKIYGANWCGWTEKLAVDTLGGFDIAGDAYVECTEEEELCASEGVQGYPTVKLNGENYTGERTLADLGEATGCAVPELSYEEAGSDDEVQC